MWVDRFKVPDNNWANFVTILGSSVLSLYRTLGWKIDVLRNFHPTHSTAPKQPSTDYSDHYNIYFEE